MTTTAPRPTDPSAGRRVARLLDDARAILPDIVEVRRRIHRHPEIGLDLPLTQAVVVEELRKLGLEPRTGTNLSSVTAVIGADRPGRTIVLRGDMDGLPLTEETGLDFAADEPLHMHACGHDTHVAMLLGGARLLVERARSNPEALPGPVLLMFQPGEEGFFGARFMIEEGLLDGSAGTPPLTPQNARAMAIHIGTEHASGEIHLRAGAMQASGDNVYITVRGQGGHAAAPHNAKDPITVAAEIVLALQVAMTRSINAFDPAVLTIAHMRAGTTTNIIPETAVIEGTYRAVSEETRAMMLPLVERVAKGIAAAHGVEVEIRHLAGYPVTVNDDEVAEDIRALAIDLVGEADVQRMPAPIMGAEDWSYVLQRIPGAMVFLGARPRDRELEGYPMNHSNLVVFDEAAMAVGAALYAKAGLEL